MSTGNEHCSAGKPWLNHTTYPICNCPEQVVYVAPQVVSETPAIDAAPDINRDLLARMFAARALVPEQRLGQLIGGALNDYALASLSSVDDEALVKMVERFAAERGGKDGGT